MKTLDDFVALVDLVLAPDFDIAAAVRRFGPIESWIGQRAEVKDIDHDLEDSVIETVSGVLAGIQTSLRTPLFVPWKEVEAVLGKAEKEQSVTGIGAPPTYVFYRDANGRCGEVSVTYYGPATRQLDEMLAIHVIGIRPEKSLPGVPDLDPGEVRR